MPAAMRPELSYAAMVMTNLYGVYVAVGGMACLVSALSDRRGRAMAIVFSIVLTSFLLNFVAQFWEPARHVAFLGVLEYYQPARILQSGDFPTQNVAILISIGGATVLLGGEVVARRSICTL
jgi:hypothetical protein